MALAHEICLTRTTLRHGVHMHQSLHYRNRLCTRRRRHLGSSAGSGPALARPVSAQYFIRWALRKSQTSDRHQSAIVQSLLLPRASRMACRLCRCTAQRRPPLSPPSTTRSCPLMKDDPSAARKTAASAMSSTDPARGMGCALENAASTAPLSRHQLCLPQRQMLWRRHPSGSLLAICCSRAHCARRAAWRRTVSSG